MLPLSTLSTTSCLSALALVAATRVASAESRSVPTAHLELHPASECGARDVLVARVQARAPNLELMEAGGELGMQARFTKLPSGRVEGVLVISPRRGLAVKRSLVARSCTEATDGLALIIAVTLGQPVSRSSAPPAETPAGERGSTPPGSAGTTGDDRKQDPADSSNAARPLGREPSSETSDAPDAREASGANSSFTLDVGAALQGVFGAAPAAMPGVAAYAMGGLGRGAFAPALGVGATHAVRTGLERSGGTAVFFLDAVMVDACPLRVDATVVELRPCAAGLLGRLSAGGRATRNASGLVARPFATFGASVVLLGRLGTFLEPSLRASLGANLVRDSFTFTPNIFHRVPPVSASVSLGLGMRAY
jgi:hypothetical protein